MPNERFQLRLICCGREADVWPQHGPGLTWAQADEYRNSYVSVAGHIRQAIIEPFDATADKEQAGE